MENENENITPNDAEEVETSEETTTDTSKEEVKEEVSKEVKDEPLKKAESKIVELKKELKDLKIPKEPEVQKEEAKTTSESDEPDYAKLAFLSQKGVEHPDDQKVVQDEAKRLKLPLTDVLEMEHIKSQLKTSKEEREAADGLPKGGTKGASTGKEDVDYYLKKGTTPDDQELAEKVIEARMKQETDGSKFSEELYTG